MKKSLLTKFFATVAFSMSALGAWAVMPEAGKVYRVVNNGYGTALADNGPTSPVGCSTISSNSLSQRWLVSAGSGNSLVFRSLGTGRYLKSSNWQSQSWSLSDESFAAACQMTVSGSGSEYSVKATGSSETLSMHCDAQGTVVCWSSENPYSKWDFVEISMTAAEVEEALSQFATIGEEVAKAPAYQAALEAIFSDAACTTLKSNYQSMSEANLKNDSNYKALSAGLQAMVLKVKSGNWAETCGDAQWDSEHARKYRVQSYEPFSEGQRAAGLAGIQAYTNMNNPTGIVGNTGDLLYVMVEGKIEEGATLYMGNVIGYGMFNNCTDGVELHEGLNIVPMWGDLSHQFIYYTVNTVKTENGRNVPSEYKVTDYSPLKIHIEGGTLNGFFNYVGDELYTPDTKEDFYYTSNRAVHPMYDIMGKYVILHFFLFDTPSKPGNAPSPGLKSVMDKDKSNDNPSRKYTYDMAQIMKVWDDMCFRERTLMGIQSDAELARYNDELLWGFYEPLTGDAIEKHPAGNTWNTDPGFQYADYFNNRMMGITMQGDLFMNATTWRTAYNISTLTAILKEIPFDSGGMWGPAHEYGHMNQTPMKFAGTTEESNNIFSNVAVYYLGLNTSRSSLPSDQLNIFNQDLTYLEHSTWGTTRMFLQLWLYYHACGNNKKFYPRLYELLRNNPRQQSYYLNMRYDQCHFAKMCCIAAQEDLTDFFDAWGFFVPLDNYHIGDYSNFMATLTKEDIKAVKDEIAALGLPKNKQIILIDDRPGITDRDSWYADEMAIEKAGVLGGIADFRGKVTPSGALSFTLDGDHMVINHENGTAGVGFLIYGEDGTLLGFSNDYNFPLKKAAVAALMSGTATVYAIGADGTTVEVANDYVNAPIEDHLRNLASLVESVSDVVGRIDEEQLKAGWYTPFYAKAFLAAYEAAQNVPADADKTMVTELYLNLVNEYTALVNHTHATVRFIPSSTYQIISAEFPKRALSASKSKAMNGSVRTTTPDSQKWKFIAAGNDNNTFYIQNVGNSLYLGKPVEGGKSENGKILNMAEKRADAGIYTVTEMSTGQWALLADGDWGYSPNIIGSSETGGICLWSASTLGSQWYLRLIEPNAKGLALANLEQLVAEAHDLLPKAGTISIDGENVDLTEDMLFSNAKCKDERWGDQFTSFNVLIDGDMQTFFHSDYSGDNTTDKLDHYIGVDLGEGKTLNSVQVQWTNRDVAGSTSAVTNMQQAQVQASNDNKSYKTLATLNNLPSSSGASYASPVISDGTDYRYWRVMCKKGAGSAGGHEYFAIAEFGISGAVENVTPFEQYPLVTPEMMLALRDQIENAESVLARSGSTTAMNNAYNALLPVYNELAAAMGVETGIDEIIFDSQRPAVEGIYDLQGRRLNSATKGGIYIINGKKVLVK